MPVDRNRTSIATPPRRARVRWAVGLYLALLLAPLHAGEARFTQVAYQGNDGGSVPGAGQYRNPVIAGFYPDPSVVRVGDDFYLVNSSFGYFPGLPLFHSRDLVDWTQIGNAIDQADQIDFGHHEITRDLFAASISYHDGMFYIVNTCVDCGGNFIITAKQPAGPWSKPVWLGMEGYDPSLFFDHDGSAWLVNSGMPVGKPRYDGHRAIWLQRFDVGTMKRTGPRRVIIDAGANPTSNPIYVEGPHLFRRGDWYYLNAAQGGTADQHAEVIWRSRSVSGPYEAWHGNPILTQRDLDPSRPDPVTSSGHAQFVALKDGSWWAVFLATRPYRGDQYNIGRETFLLPLHWHDGWPQVLPHGTAIPLLADRPQLPLSQGENPTSGPFRWTERFTGTGLPLSWMTINVPRSRWFATGQDGLTITPLATPLGQFGPGQPAYVAHRLQHHHASIELTLHAGQLVPGDRAGLALFQNETHYYAAMRVRAAGSDTLVLYRRDGKNDPNTGKAIASVALNKAIEPLRLRFRLDGPRLDADYAEGSKGWQPLASNQDASLLSTASAGGFTGATFGPYAYHAAGEPSP